MPAIKRSHPRPRVLGTALVLVGLGAWSETSAVTVNTREIHRALTEPLEPTIAIIVAAYADRASSISASHEAFGWPVTQLRDWLGASVYRLPASRTPYRLWLDGTKSSNLIHLIADEVIRRSEQARLAPKASERWLPPTEALARVTASLTAAVPALVDLGAIGSNVRPAEHLDALAADLRRDDSD